MIKILKKKCSDFFILDDGLLQNDLPKLITKIKEYYRNVDIINLKEIANMLIDDVISSIKDDNYIILALGSGGTLIVNFIENKLRDFEIIKIKWSRNWDGNYKVNFVHNLIEYNFFEKKVIIVEDVIATGNTILSVCDYIKNKGGVVCMILSTIISGSSPLLENEIKENIVVGLLVENQVKNEMKDDFDAHWNPPIYSLRHLLTGEKENPNFYFTISNIYFNGNDLKDFFKSLK